MSFGKFNETSETEEKSEDRKAEAEKKIEDYNAQLDKTRDSHWEMLKNNSSISPEEKYKMQEELHDNTEKAKAEFREEMEKKYPELKEGGMSEDEIKKEQDEIGDEL